MALKAILDLFFPPLCEGCDSQLETGERRVCKTCLIDLEPLSNTHGTHIPFDRLGAVWNYGGAAQRLITRYKEGKRELDAPLFANYLLLQIDSLQWPSPEIIVTVPQDPFKKFWMQFDPIGLIGQCVAKSLNIPFFVGLKRQGGRSSQASLTKEGRLSLGHETFFLAEGGLQGKRVLLIDDVMTTGTTLKAAANALWNGMPLSIYGLALARVEIEAPTTDGTFKFDP